MARELNIEEKNELLAQYFETDQGRRVIAQTMLEPFKLGRDYVAINRNIFAVHNVPTGYPLWYDKDPQFTAVVLANDGMVPIEVVKADRVAYEPYLITELVRIGVTEVAIRRFDILDRSQKKAAIEIAKKEDTKAFLAIDFAATQATGHNTVVTSNAGTTRAVLASLVAELEKWNAPAVTLLMHPKQFRDIRVWSRNELDVVTHYQIRKTGYLADLWGAAIRCSMLVPEGKIYAISEPQLFGVLSVRIDLSSWEAPDQDRLQYGWVFFEYLAHITVVAQGCAAAIITGQVG